MSTSTEFLPWASGLSLSDYYPRPTDRPVETAIRDDRRVILRSLKNFAWITLFSLAVPALALFDAQFIGSGSSEASATEIAQELLLLISAVMFWSAATRSVEMRPILQLAPRGCLPPCWSVSSIISGTKSPTGSGSIR